MVYISFPTEYGTLYTKEELTAIYRVCRECHLPLFIDGARLGYGLMSPKNDVTLQDLAAFCDVFYIGGTSAVHSLERQWSSLIRSWRGISAI